MAYIPTVGLEIHAELKTFSKMFCSCKNDPDEKKPNVNICQICLGHPGTLPVINKEAVLKVLRLGAALDAKLADESRFDRKNYYYPDLPKGYQISQYQYPLVKRGVLEIPTGSKIRITRVHLEEDAARLIHESQNIKHETAVLKNVSSPAFRGSSLIDYNRAGVPLMELVTEPDLSTAKNAREFAEELQLILKYLGISDADMEKGQMRVEANVSVSPELNILGTKVEVKNINSFRAVEKAIDFEIKRQSELLDGGEKVKQETRGWDDVQNITRSQRSKEEAHDYRYFPEPDLPPLDLREIPEFNLEALKSNLPELPGQKRIRLKKEYGIAGSKLEIFIQDKSLSEFFEAVVSEFEELLKAEPKEKLIGLVVNYMTSDLLGLLKEKGEAIAKTEVTPENFAELMEMLYKEELSSRGAKDILKQMIDAPGGEANDPHKIAEREGFMQTMDEGTLGDIVENVLAANEKAAADYKKGNGASLQFLIGQAMREAKRRKIGANPQILSEIIKTRFNS